LTTLPRLTLILGGARSGKSAYAERLFDGQTRPLYLATALEGDGEMAARITAHRARRGDHWQTIEVPLALPAALTRESRADRPILVDCLTLWLSNLMLTEQNIPAAFDALQTALNQAAGAVVLVGSEVGLGIVPDNPLARAFRDHAGHLHQALAAKADRVALVVAGLPLLVKDG
jgi:adenosylcobinamide kinase/adenosylcobinamide-phosphate guanylyltransferase